MTVVQAPGRAWPSGPDEGCRGRALVMLGDPEQSGALVRELAAHGWEASEALGTALGAPGPDVLVTDSAGAGLRQSLPDVPALFLASPEAAATFMGGAAAPSDDYLSGPFAREDVAVRLSWLRRRKIAGRPSTGAHRVGAPAPDPDPFPAELVVGDLALVPGSLLARRGGHGIALSKRQAALLALLMAHAGSVVGKAEILGQVWGESLEPGGWNKAELCASSLRRRINATGPPMIRTVRGAGYMIEAAASG